MENIVFKTKIKGNHAWKYDFHTITIIMLVAFTTDLKKLK